MTQVTSSKRATEIMERKISATVKQTSNAHLSDRSALQENHSGFSMEQRVKFTGLEAT